MGCRGPGARRLLLLLLLRFFRRGVGWLVSDETAVYVDVVEIGVATPKRREWGWIGLLLRCGNVYDGSDFATSIY